MGMENESAKGRWPAANGVSRRPLLQPSAHRPTLRTQEMRRTRALRRVSKSSLPNTHYDTHDNEQGFLLGSLLRATR